LWIPQQIYLVGLQQQQDKTVWQGCWLDPVDGYYTSFSQSSWSQNQRRTKFKK
jgi:hypothetical protein